MHLLNKSNYICFVHGTFSYSTFKYTTVNTVCSTLKWCAYSEYYSFISNAALGAVGLTEYVQRQNKMHDSPWAELPLVLKVTVT